MEGEASQSIIKGGGWYHNAQDVWMRGEWPSGLRHCSKNRKVPGSIPTRRSARLWDPTSLRGSR